MSTATISDEMRELSSKFTEAFAENFLGSREDRGELTLWVMPAAWRQAAQLLHRKGRRCSAYN